MSVEASEPSNWVLAVKESAKEWRFGFDIVVSTASSSACQGVPRCVCVSARNRIGGRTERLAELGPEVES